MKILLPRRADSPSPSPGTYRIWTLFVRMKTGCGAAKGDTVYASKLGDPFNWNVFDGLSTDSYAVDVGSAGDFTACCSYLGYPCMFKEEHIYKVYGDKPSNFQVMGSASWGWKRGAICPLPSPGGDPLLPLPDRGGGLHWRHSPERGGRLLAQSVTGTPWGEATG